MTTSIGVGYLRDELVYFAVVNGKALRLHSGPDALRTALEEAGAIEREDLLNELADKEFLEAVRAFTERPYLAISVEPNAPKVYFSLDENLELCGDPHEDPDNLREAANANQTSTANP